MDTPICDFLEKYSEKNLMRLHMPGHKGEDFSGVEKFDITEINGADVLYSDSGIIKKSRENASLLFGSGKTLYSTEGSSLSIRAMIYMTVIFAKARGIKPIIAAGRNAHKSFITAAALLDVDIEWIYPKENRETILSLKITPEDIKNEIDTLEKAGKKPAAVYITSPDYLGNISDIKGISEVCKSKDVLLLVDNAHGAYLNFLSESLHPIALGADACCDSAHKTLPVLTGGGYLHISKNAPEEFFEYAENAMTLFASTSPSYLILASLDRANGYLADKYREKLEKFVKRVSLLKDNLIKMGFSLEGNEPLKITVSTKSFGYEGVELAGILEEKGIVCEFSDPDYLVMMLSLSNGESSTDIIEKAFSEVERRAEITKKAPAFTKPQKRLSVREAVMLPGKRMPSEECAGKILLSPSVNCPPAVSVVVCGEEIDKNAIELMKYYDLKDCYVND